MAGCHIRWDNLNLYYNEIFFILCIISQSLIDGNMNDVAETITHYYTDYIIIKIKDMQLDS